MSKIGQKIIILPTTVTFNQEAKNIKISGTQGELTFTLPDKLEIEKVGSDILIKRISEVKKVKSLHGLYRQLLANAVSGVEKAWEKGLEIVGTGYNVKLQGEDLIFKIGYSHPVVFKKQPGIKYRVEGANKVFIIGADKQLVGQVAYQIKLIRKPDSYKGKGIKFIGEKLRIKPGKKAKAAGAAA